MDLICTCGKERRGTLLILIISSCWNRKKLVGILSFSKVWSGNLCLLSMHCRGKFRHVPIAQKRFQLLLTKKLPGKVPTRAFLLPSVEVHDLEACFQATKQAFRVPPSPDATSDFRLWRYSTISDFEFLPKKTCFFHKSVPAKFEFWFFHTVEVPCTGQCRFTTW